MNTIGDNDFVPRNGTQWYIAGNNVLTKVEITGPVKKVLVYPSSHVKVVEVVKDDLPTDRPWNVEIGDDHFFYQNRHLRATPEEALALLEERDRKDKERRSKIEKRIG